MTKFDLASWFCKAIALAGMISGGLSLLGALLSILFSSPGLIGTVLGHGIALATYFFVWLLAEGVGGTLIGEERHNSTTISRSDLRGLLLQCVGLWLVLQAVIGSSQTILTLAGLRISGSSMFPNFYGMMFPPLLLNLTQGFVGFILAFGPRLLRFIRS